MAIESREEFEDWLKERSQEVCVAIAFRAALRVWPMVLSDSQWPSTEAARAAQKKLVLLTGWGMLAARIAVLVPTPDVRSAADAAFSAVFASATAYTAARSAASAADAAFAAAAFAAARSTSASAASAPGYSAHSAARSAAAADANFLDAGADLEALLARALWPEAKPPRGLQTEELGTLLIDTDPSFAFFERWYRGMIQDGPRKHPLVFPTELLTRIVTEIPPETWDGAPENVAEEIARIEAEFLSTDSTSPNSRTPQYEPQNVSFLFDNRTIVSAGALSLSATIRHEFERFRAETGLNQTPEMFAPLEAMPGRLDEIARILTDQAQSSDTEQALREEIGRLQGLVEQYKEELAKAKADCAALENQSWKRVAAWTVGGANLAGVLAAAVWTVSGDDVGAKQRLENLHEYREVIFGTGVPPVTAP